MTDESRTGQQAVAAIIKGVAQKTAFITAGAAAAALAFTVIQHTGQRWWFIPLSILFGGALGLLNFQWLAVSVERVYLRKNATAALSNLAAAIIGIFKLSVIFVILYIVIKWRLLHIFGLVAGLSLCFAAILWEGVTMMKKALNNGNGS